MAADVTARSKRIALILDNASWHKAEDLRWHHSEPRFFPAYRRAFHPLERLRQHLKGHDLAGFLTSNESKLSDKLYNSLRPLLVGSKTIRSVCDPHTR